MQEKFFKYENNTISYLDTEQGKFPVLLIHGLTGNKSTWIKTGWIDLLVEQGFRVISYDVRGHGNSSIYPSLSDYDSSKFEQDIIKLLEYLNLSKINIIGYSMGARIAMHFSAAYPEKINSLILISIGNNAIQSPGYYKEIKEALDVDDIGQFLHPIIRGFKRLINYRAEERRSLFSLLLGDWKLVNILEIASIKVPTAIIVGVKDKATYPAKNLSDLIEGSKLLELKCVGHKNILINEKLKDFIKRFYYDLIILDK